MKKKKILVLFSFFILLVTQFIGTSSTFAKEPTKDEVYEKVMNKGELIVGLSAGYAPYEFHATVDGKDTIVGFDISIAEKIAEDMGVKLRIEELTFDALLGAMKTGKIDVIISGMSPTPERLQEVNFSESYMEVEQKIIVRKEDKDKFHSTKDFSGVSVGAQKQTTQEALAKEELIGSNIVSLQKGADVVLNLQNKKVEAIILESVVAEAYVSQDKNLVISDITFKNGEKETAIAIPKNAPVLEEKINESIRNIKKEGLLKEYKKEANRLMFDDQGFFKKYASYFIKGAGCTILLALIGVLFGSLIGGILSTMKLSSLKLLKILANIYIEFIRGTPLIAQIFLVYFGSSLINWELSAFAASCIALSLNSGAYVAELIRAGINAVNKGQFEAARSLGMSQSMTMQHIIYPQAIKNILPALGNEFVTVIKESSVVSVIGVTELMFQSSVVQGASFKPFLPVVCVSVIYFILTFSLSRLLGYFEKKMNYND